MDSSLANAAPLPRRVPAAQLFALLSGQEGATSGTLAVFDPDLRKSYAMEWKTKADAITGRLQVRGIWVRQP